MGMELSSVLLIALVVLFTGISKSAFAGALGVFSVPVLMLKLTAAEAIALMLPLLIIADLLSVKSFWKRWDSALLRSLIPGALFGIIVAHMTISLIAGEHIKWFIGAICIIFAIKNLWFNQFALKETNNKTLTYLMSGLSGYTSTIVHAGGPPLIMYFNSIGLAPGKFVSTAAAFFAIMNLTKLVGFVSLGLLTTETIVIALAFLPCAILGNWLGVKLNNRLDKQQFIKVMNGLLMLLGLWLLLS